MIQIFAGTKDNFDGRCFQSIRNLLPKRSKSLEDFAFDVWTKEVNKVKSGKKETGRKFLLFQSLSLWPNPNQSKNQQILL